MLNVVPVSEPNTLPVIYDRGLIGVMHDWYEFDDDFLKYVTVARYHYFKHH